LEDIKSWQILAKRFIFAKKSMLYIFANILTISSKIYMKTKNISMLFTAIAMPVGFFS